MYSKDTLEIFSSNKNIIKMLKKEIKFNSYTHQERIKKGDRVELRSSYNEYVYLVTSGYMKYNHDLNYTDQYQFLISPGDIATLRLYDEMSTNRPACIALTDVVWWKIDFNFFKNVMLAEDPKNIILTYHMEVSRDKLYTNYLQNLLNSKQRVLLCILMFLDKGFHKSDNIIELPNFISYPLLAEFSSTSKTYTSDILSDLRKSEILVSTSKPWIITDVKKFMNIIEDEGVPKLY
ncbi:putative transcriptional regulator [Listeria weihenstephanensis FSL R9-0317]|uniref:Crp/Fnr family transcriptional regulator n=1 Tax=Listeria weihenstephanensis TaxID=1006155 RepID=A0A1S7FQQ8_9LIST|nr:Crp/Fnr family transcriptional regulator [Listeria weihenstephanensis]AQY49730.1 hypothetical protein UE46_00725 [Listeria weihenstephanensis]EUJ41021.1 putative transcriptional regulator [Listeria weihenstephanensis FSL R9-0317]